MACRNHLATVEISALVSTGNPPQPDQALALSHVSDVQLVADPSNAPSEEIVRAWSADPRCVECGDVVASVAESALLVGPGRIAHRVRCFVPALIRLHPLLNQLAARKRAKEVQLRSPLLDSRTDDGAEVPSDG